MSQSFSLYTELTVRQNLELHARLFHLPADKAKARLAELVERFGLAEYLDQRTSDLPLGIRQRLSLAVAIVHEPEMLILDEPTSGVDPLARDQFWELLIDLSRNQGVTIFVSTHFMNEAERCDRISLMDSGRVLATDAPANLVKARGVATLEDAFISYLEEATGARAAQPTEACRRASDQRSRGGSRRQRAAVAVQLCSGCSPTPSAKRSSCCAIRSGSTFALFGTALSDAGVRLRHFDRRQQSDLRGARPRPEPREPRLSRGAARLDLFRGEAAARRLCRSRKRLQSGDIRAAVEIPPGFGRDIERGRPAWVGAWVDGAMPFRAETIRGYLQAMHQLYLTDPAVKTTLPAGARRLPDIEIRFKYNQDFDSIYAMVPSSMSMLLALFPAILMALAIVREKELGSITNLYVTPVTRIEFLLGKQIPYIGVAMANFALMFLMALVRLPGAAQGKLPDAASWRADLRHRDHGLWHADLGVRQDADRGAVRHGHSDRSAGDAVLRHVGAGLLAFRDGAAHGAGVPHDLFRADQRRHFHQGPGLRRPLAAHLAQLAVFVPVLTLISLLLLRKQER